MNARARRSEIRSIIGTLGVVTAVTGVLHAWLWLRLVHDANFSPPVQGALATLAVLISLAIPTAVAASRVLRPRTASPFVTPAYWWLGFVVLLTSLLAVTAPVRPFLDPRLVTFVAVPLAAGLAIVAALEGRRVHIARVELTLPKLPRALDGFSLVQLSDVHLGPTVDGRFLERVVARVNALAPDAVVVTGDLIDARVEQLRDEVAPLRSLTSRFGTFFVTGNHEYFAGPAEWCEHLTSLGVRVLRNELVKLERDGAVLQLAGTDDDDPAGRAEHFAEDLNAALGERDARWPVVLLAHQPKSVHAAAKLGVDLQLSGHTHGGQLWPLGWLLRLGQPAVEGLHRFADTWLYVSRGTGHSGPPMRLGVPAEITQLVLRAP